MIDPLRPTKDAFARAFRDAGVEPGETVYVAASMASLGLLPDPAARVLAGLKTVLGPEGTIVMPAFNFGFCSSGTFDRNRTPAETGVLAEHFRTLPETLRSTAPPFHSVCATGPGAADLVGNASATSFGPDSVFSRLVEVGARQILVGCGFHEGTAHVHWLEEKLEVPYRYWKKFEGTVTDDALSRQRAFFMYVRREGVRLDAEPLGKAFAESGAIGSATAGLCRIQAFRLDEFAGFGERALTADPWLLVRSNSGERDTQPPSHSLVADTPETGTTPSPIIGVDHIGVVSRYADRITDFLSAASLPLQFEGRVPDLELNCRYFDAGNCFVELVDPLSETSAVARHAERHPDSPIHHIAFRVDNLEAGIAYFSARGYAPVDGQIHLAPVPSDRVCFLSPLFTGGLLVELVDRGHDPRLISDPRWKTHE